MIDRETVKIFVDEWKERGSEKSDAQSFWLDLIHALGVDRPTKFIQFEVPIDVADHKCFIDGWIPATKVLIEQKGCGIDLDKPARQSDGKFLTPFEQALRYAEALPYSGRPRWIVVCNFVEIRVYDMDQFHRRRDDNYAPNKIAVERLPHEFSRLNFLIDPNDENVDPSIKISKQAGEIVGLIYRSFEGATMKGAPPSLPPSTGGAQPRSACPPRVDGALFSMLRVAAAVPNLECRRLLVDALRQRRRDRARIFSPAQL